MTAVQIVSVAAVVLIAGVAAFQLALAMGAPYGACRTGQVQPS